MGGMVAQHLALRHPERLRTLALGCTACGGPGSVLTPPRVIRRLMAGMQSGDKDTALRSSFDVNVGTASRDDEHFAAFRAMTLLAPAPMSTIMLQVQAIVEHDVQARLGEVGAPTLVLHGTEDQMLPVENAPIIAERIPGARLELFEGAGHLFYWEQPERTAELLREHMLGPRAARAEG
jgi:pimeloyl-ACP methyl ester carboxylesterase